MIVRVRDEYHTPVCVSCIFLYVRRSISKEEAAPDKKFRQCGCAPAGPGYADNASRVYSVLLLVVSYLKY